MSKQEYFVIISVNKRFAFKTSFEAADVGTWMTFYTVAGCANAGRADGLPCYGRKLTDII